MTFKWLVFGILSMGDLALTSYLLHHSSGRFYESNPVANWWLASYGWLGLIGFKVVICLFVGIITAVIFLRRPRAAQLVVTLGCLTLTAVLVYSGILAVSADPSDTISDAKQAQLLQAKLLETEEDLDALIEGIQQCLDSGGYSESKAVERAECIYQIILDRRRSLGEDYGQPIPKLKRPLLNFAKKRGTSSNVKSSPKLAVTN